MTDIMKMKKDGVQVYPQTHANAVVGLSTITGPQGPKGDTGAKGATGAQGPKGDTGANATTTAIATQTANGLMSATDKKKLDNLPVITFEKVGTV